MQDLAGLVIMLRDQHRAEGSDKGIVNRAGIGQCRVPEMRSREIDIGLGHRARPGTAVITFGIGDRVEGVSDLGSELKTAASSRE